MAKSGGQTVLGKAFEFACVQALYEKYSAEQEVMVEDTPQMRTAKKCFAEVGDKAHDLKDAAAAAARVIDRLEPRLRYPDNDVPLILSVQADAAGMAGDVRDVLCIRKGNRWEIGLSCKHNHDAVKHSRLSDKIDFGDKWFGYPCSDTYFSEVVPRFTKLRQMRDESKDEKPIEWDEIENKDEEYYVPILQSFMDELQRLSTEHPDVPERLIRYLLGVYDFYKVITDDSHRTTRIEAININGTLNKASDGHRAITTVPALKMPSKFYHIGFKETDGVLSQNTVTVVCDNGWELSMRMHNASKRVEPSLKFDVKLISFPSTLFAQVEPWDNI